VIGRRSTLTPDAFGKLLDSFDPDRERAAGKYEQLRRTLIRFFEWRGAPFPEEHADETFDRVSRKLGERLEIGNIGGYCYETARLICFEALKGPARKFVSLDAAGAPTLAAPPGKDIEDIEDTQAEERRLACLEDCLQALPPDRRELILEYYRDEKRARIDHRKVLAERFGLQRETLANRAQRLRNHLEDCVARCLTKGPAI
jgi:DNA-directed RNA polymerase specialized sigma24 family protein